MKVCIHEKACKNGDKLASESFANFAYNTPFTLGHGSHVTGHRCRTSAKRDWRETMQEDGCSTQGDGCTNVIAVVAVPDF